MRVAMLYTPEQARRRLRQRRVVGILVFVLAACLTAIAIVEVLSRLLS